MRETAGVAVDVFAGCGGLSLGLQGAGFRIGAAVEIDDVAADTYSAAHPSTKMITRDVRQVAGTEISELVDEEPITLLAGCAPCQGFSSLTSKHKREDPRNLLVLELARLVDELRPEAVFMENVPGLAARGRPLLEEFVRQLRTAGYYPTWRIVQMADYGVPQQRRRLVLLAGRGFAIPCPEPTHTKKMGAGNSLGHWLTLREALGKQPKPLTLRSARQDGGPRKHGWHVVRDLKPATLRRLEAAVPGATWLGVDEAVRPPCHRGGYKGFTNVYGRMTWDQTPPTITSGCTTPAKGRFGHPDPSRTTISVREAATLQTFPKKYDFVSDHIDRVCNMIGNAVPPRFARIVGEQVLRSVVAHRSALAV